MVRTILVDLTPGLVNNINAKRPYMYMITQFDNSAVQASFVYIFKADLFTFSTRWYWARYMFAILPKG